MKRLTADIIVKISSMLLENQVDTHNIENVMKELCDVTSFEYAAIYEINFNKFYLKESYQTESISLTPFLSLENYQIEDKVQYASYKNRDTQYLADQLLDIYNAQSLLVVPIIDEKKCMLGFITLFSLTTDIEYDEKSKEILTSLLYMFVHYIDRRIYIKKLDTSMTTLDTILNNSGIDVYVNDYDSHDILYVNQSMAAPYGGVKKLMGRKCWSSLFPGQTGPCEFCPKYHIVDENKEPSNVYSWDYQRPFDGSWFRVFSAAFYWENGRLAHVISSADITDNKRNEERIENLANYDQLTQLPNRRMLMKECKRRIDNATENEKGYVLFFDIDGFKNVNDGYGHDAGDEFLIKLGEFFSNIPILKDSIYRNGGDEFVAILGGEHITEDNVRDLSAFIINRFTKPWSIKGNDVYCNISIGVSCYPEDGTVADMLIQKADQAMYNVKKFGGAGVCFGHELN
ncbi:MAG: GGDEF domain-containing protein [Coprobacillus sp.]